MAEAWSEEGKEPSHHERSDCVLEVKLISLMLKKQFFEHESCINLIMNVTQTVCLLLTRLPIIINSVVRSLCSFTSDRTETPSPSEEPKFRLNCEELLLRLESLLLRPDRPEL